MLEAREVEAGTNTGSKSRPHFARNKGIIKATHSLKIGNQWTKSL